jgi:hypothetical protein
MSFMEAAPAVANLALIAQLARGRGTTELHERRVGPIAKGEQFRVDRPTLPPALWLAARAACLCGLNTNYAGVACANVRGCTISALQFGTPERGSAEPNHVRVRG